MNIITATGVFTKGVAVAPVYLVKDEKLTAADTPSKGYAEELSEFQAAVAAVVQELTDLAKTDPIFAAHLELAQDETFSEEIETALSEGDCNAQQAVQRTFDAYAAVFDNMEDAYFRERAADVRDVGNRILRQLKGVHGNRLDSMHQKSILVARDLAPSDTANMNMDLVAGFVTQEGGSTSHVAIMAKSLGLPALVGVSGILQEIHGGELLAMNAETGEILIEPDDENLKRFQKLLEEQDALRAQLHAAADLIAETTDGHQVGVYANVGSPEEIPHALSCGAMGVGLFRTEFLYMENSHFPTEEEQFAAYRKAAQAMGERELIVRTLDIGGDKTLPYYRFDPEDNPFLGYRAIRFCMGKQEIFKTQLRALLRASAYGNLKIMYPMLVDLEELEEANRLLELCKDELRREGLEFNPKVPVGMMIETPASVLLAEEFARCVDFFSIGTNDLTQYILASDRGNAKLAYLYNPFRPAVLRAIAHVIDAGHQAGIPVGMCGEFAGDESAFSLLLGLGLDEFSVAAGTVPALKLRLQKLSYAEAQAQARSILTLETLPKIRKALGS